MNKLFTKKIILGIIATIAITTPLISSAQGTGMGLVNAPGLGSNPYTTGGSTVDPRKNINDWASKESKTLSTPSSNLDRSNIDSVKQWSEYYKNEAQSQAIEAAKAAKDLPVGKERNIADASANEAIRQAGIAENQNGLTQSATTASGATDSMDKTREAAQSADRAKQTSQQAAKDNKTNASYCSLNPLSSGGSFLECVREGVGWLMGSILKLFALLLFIVGQLFDFVISYTVVNMSENIKGIEGLSNAWATLRDFTNMLMIFVLLYIGVGTIINSGGVNIKKMLPGIIIAGLFINFSLFITKAIIDVSNVATVGFYKNIVADPKNPQNEVSLSVRFASMMRLPAIYSVRDSSFANDPWSRILIVGIMGSGLMAIASFIFLAAGVLFIVRYAVLIIVMALSPIMFLGMVLPGTKKYTDQWWDALTGQVLFAPIFFVMIYITLQVGQLKGASTYGTFFPDENTIKESLGLFMHFIITGIFLFASIIIAKTLSAKSGSSVTKLSGKLSAFAGGAIFGSTAAIGRRTVGAGARALADNEKFKGFTQNKFVKAVGGNQLLKGVQGVAGSNFDARSAPGIASLVKDSAGIDFGKTQKGGYDAILKKQKEKDKAFAESLKPSDAAKQKAEEATAMAEANLKDINADIERRTADSAPTRFFDAKEKEHVEVTNMARRAVSDAEVDFTQKLEKHGVTEPDLENELRELETKSKDASLPHDESLKIQTKLIELRASKEKLEEKKKTLQSLESKKKQYYTDTFSGKIGDAEKDIKESKKYEDLLKGVNAEEAMKRARAKEAEDKSKGGGKRKEIEGRIKEEIRKSFNTAGKTQDQITKGLQQEFNKRSDAINKEFEAAIKKMAEDEFQQESIGSQRIKQYAAQVRDWGIMSRRDRSSAIKKLTKEKSLDEQSAELFKKMNEAKEKEGGEKEEKPEKIDEDKPSEEGQNNPA